MKPNSIPNKGPAFFPFIPNSAELTTTEKAGALEEEQPEVGPKGETSGSERVKGHREHRGEELKRVRFDRFVGFAFFGDRSC